MLTTQVEGSDLQVCQNLMVLVGQDRRRLSNIFADPAQQNAMDLFRERLAFKLISNPVSPIMADVGRVGFCVLSIP